MLVRVVKELWTLLALTLVCIFLGRNDDVEGFDRTLRLLFVVSGFFFYVLGWVLLRVALSRDPDGKRLRTLGRSVPVRLAGLGGLLFVQTVGILFPLRRCWCRFWRCRSCFSLCGVAVGQRWL